MDLAWGPPGHCANFPYHSCSGLDPIWYHRLPESKGRKGLRAWVLVQNHPPRFYKSGRGRLRSLPILPSSWRGAWKKLGSLWYETEHQQHPHILKSGVTTCSGVCLVPSKYPNRGSVSGQEHVVFSQKTWVWFTTHLFTTRHGVQLKARAVNSSSRGSKRPSSGLCRHLNSYHICMHANIHTYSHTHL